MFGSVRFFVMILAITFPVTLYAQTDVVYLTNGDRVTGRICSLDRGLLTVSAGPMGRVQIEWPNEAPCARTGDSFPFTSSGQIPCTTHVIFTISKNSKN
jgi:hypothetical protein